MSVIWFKVWSDLWYNKVRTLLAVLSIAAGVFAVGARFGMADQMLSTMDRSHQAVIPAHIKMALTSFVDQDTLVSIENIPGVEGVQEYNEVAIKYKVNPDAPWKQGVIYVLNDYNKQKYELIQLKEGRWPQKDDIGIERLAAQSLKLGIGDRVIFKIGNIERSFPISGKIRHPFVPPPEIFDMLFFFMDNDGVQRFSVPEGKFNSLLIRVTPYSEDHAKEVATAIKDKLGKVDIGVASTLYQDPEKHWGRSFFEAFTVVLRVLAVVSLFMSVILIFNTLSALIAQQINQIGILKAIGGRSTTIVKVYLIGVFAYGLLALIISVPLGAMLAFGVSQSFLNLFNIDYAEFQISNQALTLQLIAAIAVPLVAGLVPVLQGATITVREAIASYGLGGDFGSTRIDRVVEQIGQRLLPSHYATALGNLFRRKGRLALTQLVLVMAGTMFLMVMSLSSSISLTLDKIYTQRKYDITLSLAREQRVDRTTEAAALVEGVEKAELRFTHSATLRVGGQQVKEAGVGTSVSGVPEGSDFFKPFMLAGRWLQPGDGKVIVITKETADKSGIKLGDTVTLDLSELGKDDWQVVGLYDPVFAGGFNPATIYAPQGALSEASKRYFRGSVLLVRTSTHEDSGVNTINTQLKELLEQQGMKVAVATTQNELKKTDEFQFGIVIGFLLALAIIVAIVGGMALAGALSISVVERTKEIGVLRAVGARSRTIMGMFMMEGVLQGLISWAIAVPISFVVTRPLSDALGHIMFNADLDFQYNWQAVWMWLVAILVISMLASGLPARNATRISVRDSLAYA